MLSHAQSSIPSSGPEENKKRAKARLIVAKKVDQETLSGHSINPTIRIIRVKS
jgi:hypothetical protein